MSFLTRTAPSLASASRIASRRFSTTPAAYKTATEAVKDGVKTVDRKVADKLVDGIEIGETVAQKAKEVTGTAKAKAEDTAQQAKHKGASATEDAKSKAYKVKKDLE